MVKFKNSNCFGKEDVVKRLLKGVFENKPSLPRYTSVWNVQDVLEYLDSLKTSDLDLKPLTIKLTVLLALVSAQRMQTLKFLKVGNMKMFNDKYVFVIDSLLKQSRPGFHVSAVEVCKYPFNINLCPCICIDRYLLLTKEFRSEKNDQLLLSFQKPYKPVGTETIARWIKSLLAKAGVDISRFSAHSTRAASTSAAAATHLPIDDILKAAGWSNTTTFGKHYKKSIENHPMFGVTILDGIDGKM